MERVFQEQVYVKIAIVFRLNIMLYLEQMIQTPFHLFLQDKEQDKKEPVSFETGSFFIKQTLIVLQILLLYIIRSIAVLLTEEFIFEPYP